MKTKKLPIMMFSLISWLLWLPMFSCVYQTEISAPPVDPSQLPENNFTHFRVVEATINGTADYLFEPVFVVQATEVSNSGYAGVDFVDLGNRGAAVIKVSFVFFNGIFNDPVKINSDTIIVEDGSISAEICLGDNPRLGCDMAGYAEFVALSVKRPQKLGNEDSYVPNQFEYKYHILSNQVGASFDVNGVFTIEKEMANGDYLGLR